MKKLLALLLALIMVMAFAACGETAEPTEEPTTEPVATDPVDDEPTPEVTVMSYEEYMAADVDAKVVIETYVQACRGWWDNTICVYAQGPDGGYFMYDMACSEEDSAKLVPGTKIRVTGTKAIYDGEVEIVDGSFEFVEGGDTYIAEALDATEMTAEELEANMNKLASFKGLTVEKVTFKNDKPGDDIYVTLKKGETTYDFCVEVYLTGTETEVYKTVSELKAGDVVDVTGFLYWYNAVNTHITAITLAA